MCGRAAQTGNTTQIVANSFGVSRSSGANDVSIQGGNANMLDSSRNAGNLRNIDRDNYNMSPGMDAAVIWMENGELKMDRKVYVSVQPDPLYSLRKFRSSPWRCLCDEVGDW
jgi:hypothetical protein